MSTLLSGIDIGIGVGFRPGMGLESWNCFITTPDGAEMMTFLAPPFKWAEALSMVVKTPVDSTTYSAPTDPHLKTNNYNVNN